MTEKAAKKTAKKAPVEHDDDPATETPVSVKNNTLAHPVDRSILVGPTTADLNPAFEVEHD